MSRNAIRAKWQTPEKENKVRCGLCPRKCLVEEGKRGYCSVRENRGGELVSTAYGHPMILQIEPIEKKPFHYFMPGTRTFSIGTYGCNLGCSFCQTENYSRNTYAPDKMYDYFPPDVLADAALRYRCQSVALTYNEPTVWAEYAIDIAKEAKKRKLAVLLVTNGFISPDAAEELYPFADAANIDMKGFSGGFYQDMCDAWLEPVMHSCEYYKNKVKGHLEVTNLVIPGKNSAPDMIGEYLEWAADKLGLDTVLHFNPYTPAYQYRESPPTPDDMLHGICRLAEKRGFTRVRKGSPAL